MRVGFNPQKDKKSEPSDYFHQIVVPVYIPNHEGYFKDGLKILKYCLESLLTTSHSKTYFTVVNNGSCIEVIEYLVSLKRNKQIHELIHTTEIGKLNSVLKGLVGHSFPLVTISDSDVLFLKGWQEASYDVFENFQKAGVVCPTPSSRSYKTYTSNIYWDLFWSKKLAFSEVINPAALKAFGNSVGDKNFYNKYQLKQYLTVTNQECKVVVGAGHFAATYRGAVFAKLLRNSQFQMGGNSEGEILDIPVVKKDFWRLSTADNYAYHMGNVAEDWMEVTLKEQKIIVNPDDLNCPSFKFSGNTKLSYWLKTKLFSKIIFNRKVLRWFFMFKGMPKEIVNIYLN